MHHAHVLLLVVLALLVPTTLAEEPRPRVCDLGMEPGVLEPGPANAITDVEGVRVGHWTIVKGKNFHPALPPWVKVGPGKPFFNGPLEGDLFHRVFRPGRTKGARL